MSASSIQHAGTSNDFIGQFADAIIASGLTPPANILADGVLHRFSSSGKSSDKSGFYVLFGDGIPAGQFGCWRSNVKETFCTTTDHQFTKEEKAAFKTKMEAASKAREEDQIARRKEAEVKANQLWTASNSAPPDYVYLLNKKVKPHGLKIDSGKLIVPIKVNGKITSLQYIDGQGNKRFMYGGQISGGYFAIGQPGKEPMCICEGFATGASIHEATGYPVAIAFNAGNLKAVSQVMRNKFPDTQIIICADDDYQTKDNPGLTKAKDAAKAIKGSVATPSFGKNHPEGATDFNDLAQAEGINVVKEIISNAAISTTIKIESRFKVDSLRDFLNREIPAREEMLSPWLPMQGLAMVYAPRGVGKTWFGLNVAYAVATGGTYLKWRAPKPRGVLYLDGEMPAITMQERLATIVAQVDGPAPARLDIFTPDIQKEYCTPNLASLADTTEIDSLLGGIDLIVVDNISTLISGQGRENDEESWRNAQDWLLRQRAQGRSVLLIHHAGKGGQQRGTSKREDVLDTIINLKHPAQYEPSDGAKFEIHFEKSRGFYGDDANALCASLGAGGWSCEQLTESTYELVISLVSEDLQPNEIASELGIHKSNVSRHLKKARAAGRIQ